MLHGADRPSLRAGRRRFLHPLITARITDSDPPSPAHSADHHSRVLRLRATRPGHSRARPPQLARCQQRGPCAAARPPQLHHRRWPRRRQLQEDQGAREQFANSAPMRRAPSELRHQAEGSVKARERTGVKARVSHPAPAAAPRSAVFVQRPEAVILRVLLVSARMNGHATRLLARTMLPIERPSKRPIKAFLHLIKAQ